MTVGRSMAIYGAAVTREGAMKRIVPGHRVPRRNRQPKDIPPAQRSVSEETLAIRFVRDADPPDLGVEKFGDVFLFSDTEHDQFESLRDLIVRYACQETIAHPLCLAVFGPPGSGKSFAVKEVRKAANTEIASRGSRNVELGPLVTVNLTQVSDGPEVARVLARVAGEQDKKTVPIVFFDEFDAPRDGSRYAWLSWFLAPMHDGLVLHEGAIIRLKRAVYVFAGGTAATMKEFSQPRDAAAFRDAKGPDFISRLRGFLDVPGPNAERRMLRRAVILRHNLRGRRISEQLLRRLLKVGRFRHGARSIEALLEMSRNQEGAELRLEDLPPAHLLGLHVDHGPLDLDTVGGWVALSGYSDEPATKQSIRDAWLAVAQALWQEGATLAFGGGKSQTLRIALKEELERVPPRMLTPRGQETPRLVLRGDPKSRRPGIAFEIPELRPGDDELPAGISEADRLWLRAVIGEFRRRLLVSERSVARFAIAGIGSGFPGRYPGIAEELMLSLALGKPVYIAGGFDGAARDVGNFLGLASPERAPSFQGLKAWHPPQREKLLDDHRALMQAPPWRPLPATSEELIGFFKSHAMGSEQWPPNGLSRAENRELFECEDPNRVAALVAHGLVRLFGAEATDSSGTGRGFRLAN